MSLACTTQSLRRKVLSRSESQGGEGTSEWVSAQGMADGESFHADMHYPIITHSNVHLTARKCFVLKKDAKRQRVAREREAVADEREFSTRTVHASKLCSCGGRCRLFVY